MTLKMFISDPFLPAPRVVILSFVTPSTRTLPLHTHHSLNLLLIEPVAVAVAGVVLFFTVVVVVVVAYLKQY